VWSPFKKPTYKLSKKGINSPKKGATSIYRNLPNPPKKPTKKLHTFHPPFFIFNTYTRLFVTTTPVYCPHYLENMVVGGGEETTPKISPAAVFFSLTKKRAPPLS